MGLYLASINHTVVGILKTTLQSVGAEGNLIQDIQEAANNTYASTHNTCEHAGEVLSMLCASLPENGVLILPHRKDSEIIETCTWRILN